ncbi:MAG: polyprenyl synthetase family protein, partial [Burkholderiales bacterium]|nr:polyprenyl synthetase family protein [Phycisphaerae bacterium]
SQWHGAPPRLLESIDYSLSAGGKRLRPALILETFDALAPADADAGRESALSSAAAMELVHTFSLVHDDLPAMDNDDFRRGKPTNHKVYGDAMAILAGDAMLSMAFEMIAMHAQSDLVAALVREIAGAAGPSGMIGGQVLDIQHENQTLTVDQLRQIHRMKTGAMLTSSCRLGAICARADVSILRAVADFGEHLGLAFQIVDDILDETATLEQMGKNTRKDRDRGKNTYPQFLGLIGAKNEAQAQIEAAVSALGPLNARGCNLAAIARFVIDRLV